MGGRQVKIFLADGSPTGLITAEIINWTGKIVVAPRSQLADIAKRDEVKRAGLYFLVGSNPEDPSEEILYIGESDSIWSRLTLHNKSEDKDFWEKTILVTSKDENLTKSHCRYLESRLIQIATQAKRAQVKNGTNPEITSLPEPDIADMEFFLEQIQLILPVLGFTFVNPLPVAKQITNKEEVNEFSPIFSMVSSGANARAQEINNEFVILAGSLARKNHVNSLVDSFVNIRKRLIHSGSLAESHENRFWVFTQNVPFKSPSTAAMVVAGASINGRISWKIEGTDITYAQWSEEQIEKAGSTTVENIEDI